jgi:hypothetical protein
VRRAQPIPRRELRRHVNYTAEIGDDTMHQREAKARAIADTFRGEKRIEHAREHSGRNAAAGIAHQGARSQADDSTESSALPRYYLIKYLVKEWLQPSTAESRGRI